jgi:hypothetical protein
LIKSVAIKNVGVHKYAIVDAIIYIIVDIKVSAKFV